jgi:DNA helicase-2/ATP-dependent DNA helicase PcrA
VLPHERVGQHPDELEEERRLTFVGITRAKDELQLSYAVTRDFRGVRRRTIPSSFFMEMPREEMEMVDAAAAFEVRSLDPWAEPDHKSEYDSWDGRQMEDVAAEAAHRPAGKPAFGIAATSITTAAALHRAADPAGLSSGPQTAPRISPDEFRPGMAVTHPEYGPGKIVALSGAGKNCRATIQFATVGAKKIILAHSAVRPAR